MNEQEYSLDKQWYIPCGGSKYIHIHESIDIPEPNIVPYHENKIQTNDGSFNKSKIKKEKTKTLKNKEYIRRI